VQVIGFLARSADDLELALRLASGPDGIDRLTVPAPRETPGEAMIDRAAVWDGPASPGVREDVIETVRRAARALEGHGFRIEDEPPVMLERAVTLYSALRDLDRLQDVRNLIRGHESEVGEDVRAAIAAAEETERRTADLDGRALWEERDGLRGDFGAYLDRYRVVLMPVATVPPYALEGPPPSVRGREQSMWDVLAPCRLISLFGVPAVSVPFGTSTDGWPIGVQVVGRPYREDEVLAVARLLMHSVPDRRGSE